MRTTTLTIKRPDNTIFATGLLAQVDQASDKSVIEHLQIGDHHVGDMWAITTLGWNPAALIRRGDLLIDEIYTDADKAAGTYPFAYRVISRPKDYWLHHQSLKADSAVGN
jgi:hypothetical protein